MTETLLHEIWKKTNRHCHFCGDAVSFRKRGYRRQRADDSRSANYCQSSARTAGGMKPEEILQDFPYLEQADIDACLEYAARHAAHREIPLSK